MSTGECVHRNVHHFTAKACVAVIQATDLVMTHSPVFLAVSPFQLFLLLIVMFRNFLSLLSRNAPLAIKYFIAQI